MNLVSRGAHWCSGIGVSENRKIISIGRFGAHDVVVHNMTGCAHVAVWNNGAIWVAEQTGVYPREVAEVGEVFKMACK